MNASARHDSCRRRRSDVLIVPNVEFLRAPSARVDNGVAVHAAEECVQLHGGIGMTWEYPAHLYLKRVKSDQLSLGTAYPELVDLPVSS